LQQDGGLVAESYEENQVDQQPGYPRQPAIKLKLSELRNSRRPAAVLRNSPVDPRCRFEANRSSGIAAVLREGTAATWEEVVLRRRSAANLEELRAVLDSGRVYQADLEGPYGIKGFCT